jgi:hypothetical protein
MYAEPQTSLGDIVRYFTDEGIDFNGGRLQRVTRSNLLRNPSYAQADLDIYDFFKAQGAIVESDAADFAGTNGCYLYRGRDVAGRTFSNLKDQILVVALHEGIVSSDIWLACRKKLIGNKDFCGASKKVKNTWLAGKIKCGRCGAALVSNSTSHQYFRCRKRADNKSCEGGGKLRVRDFENAMYESMCLRADNFKTLTGGNPAKANPKLTAHKVELAQVEAEIEKLLDTLTGANQMLLSYANSKIEELDAKRQSLMKAIADLSVEAVSPEQLKRVTGFLDNWDNTSFEEKRETVDILISTIKATSENVNIEGKI